MLTSYLADIKEEQKWKRGINVFPYSSQAFLS